MKVALAGLCSPTQTSCCQQHVTKALSLVPAHPAWQLPLQGRGASKEMPGKIQSFHFPIWKMRRLNQMMSKNHNSMPSEPILCTQDAGDLEKRARNVCGAVHYDSYALLLLLCSLLPTDAVC